MAGNYFTIQYEYDAPSLRKPEKRVVKVQAKNGVDALKEARRRAGKHGHNFNIIAWAPASYSHERRFAD